MKNIEKVVSIRDGSISLDLNKEDAISILCQVMMNETIRLQNCQSQCDRDSIRQFLLKAFSLITENEIPVKKCVSLKEVMEDADKEMMNKPFFDTSKIMQRAYQESCLKRVRTCDLVAELRRREGVEAHQVEPYKKERKREEMLRHQKKGGFKN